MYQPGPTEADIIEFMNAKVQRLAHTLTQLMYGKPAANLTEAVVNDGLLSPELAEAVTKEYDAQRHMMFQVLIPIPSALLSEVVSGEYKLLDELWPQIKEVTALEIASFVLRHKRPDPLDFDTKIILGQMLDPDNRKQ